VKSSGHVGDKHVVGRPVSKSSCLMRSSTVFCSCTSEESECELYYDHTIINVLSHRSRRTMRSESLIGLHPEQWLEECHVLNPDDQDQIALMDIGMYDRSV
jgi:hypothetical protein